MKFNTESESKTLSPMICGRLHPCRPSIPIHQDSSNRYNQSINIPQQHTRLTSNLNLQEAKPSNPVQPLKRVPVYALYNKIGYGQRTPACLPSSVLLRNTLSPKPSKAPLHITSHFVSLPYGELRILFRLLQTDPHFQ